MPDTTTDITLTAQEHNTIRMALFDREQVLHDRLAAYSDTQSVAVRLDTDELLKVSQARIALGYTYDHTYS